MYIHTNNTKDVLFVMIRMQVVQNLQRTFTQLITMLLIVLP